MKQDRIFCGVLVAIAIIAGTITVDLLLSTGDKFYIYMLFFMGAIVLCGLVGILEGTRLAVKLGRIMDKLFNEEGEL
jgi:hypothetical protein